MDALCEEEEAEAERRSLLVGMMSPVSGYSSGDEDDEQNRGRGPMYASETILASVQVCVRLIRVFGKGGG
jgi:hypothetical protein